MQLQHFRKELCRSSKRAYTCAFEFEGDVQEVGYRLKAWTVALGQEAVCGGRLENTDSNRMRIYLTSKKLKELESAYNELQKQGNIPAHAKVIAVRQIDANGTNTLPAQRVTDILMLEQQGKGVDYMKAILEQLSAMNKKSDIMSGKLNELPSSVADTLGKKFDELPGKISGELGKKFDELPERIAKAMKSA